MGVISVNVCSNYSFIPGVTPCKWPFLSEYNCTKSYADMEGISFNVSTAYTALLGFIGFIFNLYRIIKLNQMKKEYPKVWQSSLQHYACALICSTCSMLYAIDLQGNRGLLPRALSDFFNETRIGMAYMTGINLIFQWVAIVQAKGNDSSLGLPLTITKNFLRFWFTFNGAVLPPIGMFIVPDGSVYGLHNGATDALKYATNGFFGTFTALSITIYGWRLYNAMGGTATLKKISAKGEEMTQVDKDRLISIRRIVVSMTATSILLFLGSGYGLLLFFGRLKWCYWYDVLSPSGGYGSWFSLVNVCMLMFPIVLLVVLALPGQKSFVKKMGDAVSTAMSKTKAGGSSKIIADSSGKSSKTISTTNLSVLSEKSTVERAI